uniref:CCHC-type domain-containing protein n=1 Tax=Nicotiana tabacum TaxID=4097 RepID=A0A1S4AJM3_TOBAC
MTRTRNSNTDTQDASQETIATIVAQGRNKKASTQKRRGKSTKDVQVPRVEQEEGVEHDDPIPQDPVLAPTAAPAHATISPENERRDEIPPQLNRQSNSESSRVNEFLKLSPPVFHGSIVDKDPMLWLEGVKKALRVMKSFDDEAVELAAYQLRDVAGAWFVGGLAYHIKDTTSAVAVGMEAFSSVVGFSKHLEKDKQLWREEKELNKKAHTTGRFNGTSSGGGRDSSNKESLVPTQFSHQSGGGSSFRRTQSNGNQSRQNQNFRTSSSHSQNHAEQHSGQCKLGFHGCYHCGDIGHIKANCPKLRCNLSGGPTHPSSSSATAVALPQARGSHNQIGYGVGRGANRVTQGGGQPRLFATLDRQSAEAYAEVIT